MKTREKEQGYHVPKRVSYPREESLQYWLTMLLDAYHLVDQGIAKAIAIERKRGRKVACGKGCSTCCETHKTIPVYPLELVGISWFITEKISGPQREVLKAQLRTHGEHGPCPFLIDKDCAVHPVRPVSCRQFIVFGKPCSEGEDPYYTRRPDVLTPIQRYVEEAFFTMLPFYGVHKESDRKRAIESRSIHGLVRLLHTCNWKSLVDRMDEFDKQGPQERQERR